MDDLVPTILDAAAASGGVIDRRQLSALGVSHFVIRRLVALGVLVPIASRVFAIGGRTLGREQHLQAAHLQAGDVSVISHHACAESWGFPSPRKRLPEVSIPHDAPRPRSGHGAIHRSRDLDPRDITPVFGIPHTTPRRTLLDIAPSLSPKRLDRCLQFVCHRRLATAEEVHELVEALRRQGRPGVAELAPLARRAIDRLASESELEAMLHRLIEASDLPMPVTQHPVNVDGHHYRPDHVWLDARLIVETDGHLTHATKADRQHDAERLARLQLAGFRVLVFTWDDVTLRPDYVLETIRRHLALPAAA